MGGRAVKQTFNTAAARNRRERRTGGSVRVWLTLHSSRLSGPGLPQDVIMKESGMQEKVPIDKKALLTIMEAAELTNIGQNKIRELINTPTCPFVLRVGTKNLIKRERFLSFLESKSVI